MILQLRLLRRLLSSSCAFDHSQHLYDSETSNTGKYVGAVPATNRRHFEPLPACDAAPQRILPPGRCPDLALHLRDRGRAAVARFFEVAASDISEETWDALTESLGLHVEMGKVRARRVRRAQAGISPLRRPDAAHSMVSTPLQAHSRVRTRLHHTRHHLLCLKFSGGDPVPGVSLPAGVRLELGSALLLCTSVSVSNMFETAHLQSMCTYTCSRRGGFACLVEVLCSVSTAVLEMLVGAQRVGIAARTQAQSC